MPRDDIDKKTVDRRVFILGFGFFGISILWAAYNSFVPVLLKKFIAYNALIGLIMTIDNIFAVTVQPAVGAASDRTFTRFGKRKPYIILGAPLAAACFAMIPFIDVLLILIAVLLLMNLSMALFRSPMIALMPDLVPSEGRSRANGIINFMGGLGSLIAFFLGGMTFDFSPRTAFAVLAAVMLCSIASLVIFIREKPSACMPESSIQNDNAVIKYSITALFFAAGFFAVQYFGGFGGKWLTLLFMTRLEGQVILSLLLYALILLVAIIKDIRKTSVLFFIAIFAWFFGYNGIETFFTLFCREDAGISTGRATMLLGAFSIGFIVSAVPSGILAGRFGREKMIIFGLLALAVIAPLVGFSRGAVVIALLMLLGGGAWAAVNINSYPLVCDLAPEGRLGTYTGYYYFFSMLAQTLSPPLNGMIIDRAGSYNVIFFSASFCFVLSVFLVLLVRKKIKDLH